MSRRKEFNDIDQANDLSIIVGIGRKLIMFLKCISVLVFLVLVVDIWERNKELIRKRTDIGEHFTREVIQSIVYYY